MNRKELINKIAEVTESTKVATETFVDAYEEIIKNTLSAGEPVELYNFMKLEVKDVAGRKGRNPRTGEEIQIPPGKKVSLKALKGLKDCVGGR